MMSATEANPTTTPESTPATDQPGRFIVGMSRAATTWIGKCLCEHTQVASFGENGFWGKRFIEPESPAGYSRAQIDRILAQQSDGRMVNAFVGTGPGTLRHVTRENIGDLLREEYASLGAPVPPGELFRASQRAIARAEHKRYAIDKTPQNLYWIARISEQMPEARFVVMVREPYGFMLSYKHQGDRKPDAIKREFERLYHPIACALVWRAYARSSLAAQAHHGQRVLTIRYEEVRKDPEGVLERAQQHFGLPVEPIGQRVPRDNTSFPKGERPTLPASHHAWMNLICGRLIRSHGFEFRRSGANPLAVAWHLISLPFWLVRNVGPFKRAMNMSLLGYVRRLLFR